MSKKIKGMIYIACTLWIVFFSQVIVTKLYVGQADVTQAFARNQLVVEKSSTEIDNICKDGGWLLGKVPGKLTREEKQKITDSIFGYMGGANINEHDGSDYYVAYGYSNGINIVKKVNGRTINMNVAITYDEINDKSYVYFGVPIMNLDF